jgi:hypothetical protein
MLVIPVVYSQGMVRYSDYFLFKFLGGASSFVIMIVFKWSLTILISNLSEGNWFIHRSQAKWTRWKSQNWSCRRISSPEASPCICRWTNEGWTRPISRRWNNSRIQSAWYVVLFDILFLCGYFLFLGSNQFIVWYTFSLLTFQVIFSSRRTIDWSWYVILTFTLWVCNYVVWAQF